MQTTMTQNVSYVMLDVSNAINTTQTARDVKAHNQLFQIQTLDIFTYSIQPGVNAGRPARSRPTQTQLKGGMDRLKL